MTDIAIHETKALVPSPDINSAFDGFMRAFDAFKDTNDSRLAALERRQADILADEKLARIEAALDAQKRTMDDLVLKARRPVLAGSAGESASPEHKAAFEAYVRAGDTGGFRDLETRAMSLSASDGGYTVPPEVEATINRRLAQISPIRAIAGIRQVSGAVYKRPVIAQSFATGWVGDTDTRPATATPALSEQLFQTMELYANPAATQALLDDSAVDLERWIADEVEMAFAEQEGDAFVTGDGVKKPTGFLTGTPVANSAWAWGALGFIASGAAAGLATANASDRLIDLVYALRAGYRQNGRFVMNRKMQAEIRKLKDNTGNYLWSPPAQAGGEASLMTFPISEAEAMPDMAANSFPIAFGDFRRGYLIVDRVGVRILRDPYSMKPYVSFYTTKRVGGGIADWDAIKLLKIAA